MSVKDKITKSEDWQEYTLTEQESTFINFVNNSSQQEIAGFLTVIATTRFDYPSDATLQYDIDFTDKDRKVKIRVAPAVQPEP